MSSIRNLAGSVLAILALVSFVAMLALPAPRTDWIHVAWMLSSAATVTFLTAGDKPKPSAERIKNAVVTCIAIGGFCALIHGAPELDESGNVVFEGFKASFDARAGVGAGVFLKLLPGAVFGIYLAEIFREPLPPAQ